MPSSNSRAVFWWVAGLVVVLDVITKRLAVAKLTSTSASVVGDWLVLRLVYNPGAAFGINVGAYSRWVFMALAVVALVVLGAMVKQTAPAMRFRLVTLGLVCGGAVGNLIDRVASSRGVVDFIDVWVGTFHWPTFNVADMAVSCGAIALAAVLWSEGRHEKDAAREPTNPAEAAP